MRDRISRGAEVDSSATVNDWVSANSCPPWRWPSTAAQRTSSADTRAVLSTRLVEASNSAVYDIVRQQSEIGMSQERLTQANERISIETQALERRVSAAEEVDPYEVAQQLSLLMTRMEASYSVTSRLQKFS